MFSGDPKIYCSLFSKSIETISLLGTELTGLSEALSLRIRRNCQQLRLVYGVLCYENELEIFPRPAAQSNMFLTHVFLMSRSSQVFIYQECAAIAQ